MRLGRDDYRLLAALARQPQGQQLVLLLRRALHEADVALRSATGERVGWLQGETQCLERWVKAFEEADQFAR